MNLISTKSLPFFIVLFFVTLIGRTQQLAFPGAEGFGRFTTGGRGGSVYYVTNLLDDNKPGCLRYGLTKLTGARTILFKVSGTIPLTTELRITKGNVTIAGQSAPGDGICLKNYTIRTDASNIIVRYLRSRMGDSTKYIDDAMDGNGSVPVTINNIIVDHCSMSWSIDEVGSFYDNKNFTMQWCILSESLYHSVDPKGNHGYGGIWGGQGATFHHNLLAHNSSRNPRFCGSRYTGDSINEIVDMRNNVIYNWGNINSSYGGESGNYNMINNYYKYGPATPNNKLRYRILNYTTYYFASDAFIYPDTVWGGKFYVNGNYVYGYPATTTDNWNGGGTNPGVQSDNALSNSAQIMARGKLTAPLTVAPVTTQTAQDAFYSVLDYAGATLPKRDTIDRRIVKETRTGTATYNGTYNNSKAGSGIIDSQNNVGGWPTLSSSPAPFDTDNDGMPDQWETQRGLNPVNASDRNNFNINGYTNLENYLNGDSIIALGTNNTCVFGQPIISSNNGNWINLKDNSYTSLISTDTMNVIASILDSVSLGQVRGSYYVTNTIRNTTSNIPYLNRNIFLSSDSSAKSYFKLRLYITTAELNQLMVADTSIHSINDLAIVRTDDTVCNNQIAGNTSQLLPLATGLWGTYSTGYFIDVSTNKLGAFFFMAKSATLPVQLIDFKAERSSHIANLAWTTAQEINVKRYEIERSSNNGAFSSVGSVVASNIFGNQTYSYSDYLPESVRLIHYRLKIIDKDGHFTYSAIRTITEDPSQAAQIVITPNPAKDFVKIQAKKMVQIKLFDPLGRSILYKLDLVDQYTIPTKQLSKGVYIVEVVTAEGKKGVEQLIIE